MYSSTVWSLLGGTYAMSLCISVLQMVVVRRYAMERSDVAGLLHRVTRVTIVEEVLWSLLPLLLVGSGLLGWALSRSMSVSVVTLYLLVVAFLWHPCVLIVRIARGGRVYLRRFGVFRGTSSLVGPLRRGQFPLLPLDPRMIDTAVDND